MTIPTKPLTLTFDPDELYLPDLEMIEGERGVSATELRAFLKRYGNWSDKELSGLQRKDLREVFALARKQIFERLLPKANETP